MGGGLEPSSLIEVYAYAKKLLFPETWPKIEWDFFLV